MSPAPARGRGCGRGAARRVRTPCVAARGASRSPPLSPACFVPTPQAARHHRHASIHTAYTHCVHSTGAARRRSRIARCARPARPQARLRRHAQRAARSALPAPASRPPRARARPRPRAARAPLQTLHPMDHWNCPRRTAQHGSRPGGPRGAQEGDYPRFRPAPASPPLHPPLPSEQSRPPCGPRRRRAGPPAAPAPAPPIPVRGRTPPLARRCAPGTHKIVTKKSG